MTSPSGNASTGVQMLRKNEEFHVILTVDESVVSLVVFNSSYVESGGPTQRWLFCQGLDKWPFHKQMAVCLPV